MNSGKSKVKTLIAYFAVVVILGCGALVLGQLNKGNDHTAAVETKKDLQFGEYNLTKISMDRTPYVGNHSKVLRLVGQLPKLDPFYTQRYISLQTTNQPYGLTAYYEQAEAGVADRPTQSDHEANSKLGSKARTHALVLFAMIDNVDEITFAFRSTPSTGRLDESAYDIHVTFYRSDLEKNYNIKELSHNLKALGQVISEL